MTAQAAMTGSYVELPTRSRVRRIRDVAIGNPLGSLGLGLILLVCITALVGPFLVAEPELLSANILQGPSKEHWFGTDLLGRDYFARVVVAARLSLLLAVTAMAIGTLAALLVGMVSAYLGGIFDLIAQRIVDVMLAFPGLILLMLVAEVVGRDWQSLAIGLGLLFAVGLVRIIRAYTLRTLAESYVEAARVVGAGPARILVRHMLPNIGPPLMVYVTALMGAAILAEGSLAFLGLGISPPTPSWGRMLAEGRSQWREPHLSIFPGVAMTITVLGFNLLGDALRDIFDPRLRGASASRFSGNRS